jgi:hypothetical protein
MHKHAARKPPHDFQTYVPGYVGDVYPEMLLNCQFAVFVRRRRHVTIEKRRLRIELGACILKLMLYSR